MKLSKKLYDPRFDSLQIEYGDIESFVKKRALDVISAELPEDQYVTLEELQSEFGISRYQIVGTLKKMNVSPIGIKKNIVNGQRLRGVGKIVYDSKVIEQIYAATPVEKIKAEARAILEE